MLIAPIREHVLQTCQREQNILGPSFFPEHVVVVANCGVQLAASLDADAEIVELAAYLHDLSAICDPSTFPIHAQASATLARDLLNERGYPPHIVSSVADAIASHSAPLQVGSASPEAVCLSNADAVARILRPAYWLYFAFRVRGLGFVEGRDWLRSLLESQWCALIEPAKELVGAQYSATIDLLRTGTASVNAV